MLNVHYPERGFGLVEILVTLGVLSIGVVGLVALQGTVFRQSLDNKSRTEALALAQSRIEELRNYTGKAGSPDEFNNLYPIGGGIENATTITGVNAVFRRTEQASGEAGIKHVLVQVAWTGPDGADRDVKLNTAIAFIPPRTTGDLVLDATAAIVASPTGRAKPGEQTLPPGARVIANGDGTSLYQNGGSDLALVSGNRIVLTLDQACRTDDGNCGAFTRIKGSVYIDTETQNSLAPGEVHVVASDSAFCTRYFVKAGILNSLTPATTTALSTPNGDYEYFEYTCYVGGGWHGNIGIVLASGLKPTDKICMGDPLTGNAWEFPTIAARRVYRGMLFRHDTSTRSGKEELTDGQGGTLVRYYTHGVADGVELPAPGKPGHDFVIATMPAGAAFGSACSTESIMLRPDSALHGGLGDRFAGMPADFVCLNNGYLDSYDPDLFGHTVSCPYNPSDPPATRHQVTGNIEFAAIRSPIHDALAASIYPVTSDGPGNCLIAPFTHDGKQYVSSYQCDVYDWGKGWNGYIEIFHDAAAMSCDIRRLYLDSTTRDSKDNDFSRCNPGAFAVFTGTVTTAGPHRLQESFISGGGDCIIAGDGLSYQCITQNLVESWTGTLSFTANSGTICSPPTNDGIFSYKMLTSGHYTRNLTIADNKNDCN